MGSYLRGASGNGECVHFCYLRFENGVLLLTMWIFCQGFCDDVTNKKLLKKNNGSIKGVVMDLLTGEKEA